ncbi:hypothetical protein CGGC5_v005898 [Colletotrichum fructicola Nara gc5]|uniref:Uncharacterized protein n=1 Tax=Colletotrichum fructicola (strain Nara gc5) TaxID=1213859 RepID=L2G155_COLFN|nr:hypothetical protein CGGC5_v005898 [Colletotrichum fructicola Nara gc5]
MNPTHATHDVVYSKPGLQPLAGEFSQGLEFDSTYVAEGGTELRLYRWKEEHYHLTKRYMEFYDATDLKSILGTTSPENGALCHRIKSKLKGSGLLSPSNSTMYHPQLFELRSGTHWIASDRMAVIFLFGMGSNKEESAAYC